MTATHNSPIVSLASAPAGSTLIVSGTSGGQHFQRKIAALGIYPDEKLEVIERQYRGALIIKVKGTRLAIGREMSKKIKVRVVSCEL